MAEHVWTGCQLGGNPANAESYEWIRYCKVCGMEDTCEDPLPECPGEDEDTEIGWCSSCDRIATEPAPQENGRPVCPNCGDWLIYRSDDTPEPPCKL